MAVLVVMLVGGAGDARAASFVTRVVDAGWNGDNHYVTGILVTKRTPEAFPCVQGRTIVVKNVATGKIIGTGRSRSERMPGEFRISLGGYAPVGRYNVIAKRKRIGATVCKQGSVTITQPHPEND